ncbi:MAG: CDP-alcohol phosphatidyltransferase family protein [Candidatus Micrarchaeota archaeon]
MRKERKEKLESLFSPIAVNVNPNYITLVSVVLAIVAAYFTVKSQLLYAVVLFAAASLLDAYDGVVARKFKSATERGAFLDRVADRVVDAVMIMAVVYAGFVELRIGIAALFLVLFASYISATLEVISKTRVGERLSLRPLRSAVMFAGLFLQWYAPGISALRYAVYVLLALSVFSVGYRLSISWKVLSKKKQK